MKQYTFMMLKPDAYTNKCATNVIKDLESHGLTIEKRQELVVNMDIMKVLLEHYKAVIDEMGKDFNFPGKLFNSFYYDGPHQILPMMVSYEGEENIITYTRELVGKTNPQGAAKGTIRATYSNDNYDKAGSANRLVNNVIHASDSEESAKRELAIWAAYL